MHGKAIVVNRLSETLATSRAALSICSAKKDLASGLIDRNR